MTTKTNLFNLGRESMAADVREALDPTVSGLPLTIALNTLARVEATVNTAAVTDSTCPDGYEVDQSRGDEVAAITECRGLAHDNARYSITKAGDLVAQGGEREGMPPAAWQWLIKQWGLAQG